jgi:hypothetical protein
MVPARLKEWAYAGFAITLLSALVAHLAVGDGVEASSWTVRTAVLWGVSYFFWRRLQATPANNTSPSESPAQFVKTSTVQIDSFALERYIPSV